MKFRICFGFFMILWVFGFSSMPSFSTLVKMMTFEELVKEADYIILGTVKGDMRHTEEWEEAGQHFYVYVDILVEKVIKSSKRSAVLKKGSLITLRYPDPTKVVGFLAFEDRERAIWFLKSDPRKTGYFYILGDYQGRFLIDNNVVYKNVTFKYIASENIILKHYIGNEEYEQGALKDFIKRIKATIKAIKKGKDIAYLSKQIYEQLDPEKRKWFFYNGSRQKEPLRIEIDKFVIIYKQGISETDIEQFHQKHRMKVLSKMERERETSPPSSPLPPVYLVSLPKGKKLKAEVAK